jgi:hypothetical protein
MSGGDRMLAALVEIMRVFMWVFVIALLLRGLEQGFRP